jgi:rare lipoprotein A
MKIRMHMISAVLIAIFLAAGSPYHAMGEEKADSGKTFHIAEGRASYYADRFHSKRTASGEKFSLLEYTAAHRSLPFGTTVRVTNLDNGRNVTVRINDRGPHLRNRIIDVSPAAAKELGLLGKGTTHVRIEAMN